MPDHTDDGQQPPRRTMTRPPLFTPRVTRSDTPGRERAVTVTRRSSRLFTPPRVPRQTTPAAGEPAVPPAAPAAPVAEGTPSAIPAAPSTGDAARVTPAAGGAAAVAPSSPATEPSVPNAPSASAPPPAAPGAAAAGASAPSAPSPAASGAPTAASTAAPNAPFVVGDIETADIALTASEGSALIDRADASIPEADAASAIMRDEPSRPEPRETIGGVEIERPVWTFLPETEGSLSALELPALPAMPAELDNASEPPVIEGLERSRDVGPWEDALAQPETPDLAAGPGFERASLASPEYAEPRDLPEYGAVSGVTDSAVFEERAVEREAVTQEMDAFQDEALEAEAGAAPAAGPHGEEPAASIADDGVGETEEPPHRTSAAPAASAEEEVDEAWAEATRPDAADHAAFPDEDALGVPMVEGPRQRYFASRTEPELAEAEATAREVDEMTAALGWPETPAGSMADVAAALPALDAELRASAALFATAQGAAPAADVAAALERIARRIRDGQVVLPRDAAATSEESALAVTLAALLKGPPRG